MTSKRNRTSKWRGPKNEADLKNEDDLKNEGALKNEVDLNNEDNLTINYQTWRKLNQLIVLDWCLINNISSLPKLSQACLSLAQLCPSLFSLLPLAFKIIRNFGKHFLLAEIYFFAEKHFLDKLLLEK